MDPALVADARRAVDAQPACPVHRMSSGAGHDAMIVAARMPAAMLFLRSPGGISHHPDEAVPRGGCRGGARRSGLTFLDELARRAVGD